MELYFQNMTNFPNEKWPNDGKPPHEEILLADLREGHLTLPPATFDLIMASPSRDSGYDGILQANWHNGFARYAFDYKTNSSPHTLSTTSEQLRKVTPPDLLPLLILPYLSEEALYQLDSKGISGVDLCGNGVLIAPQYRIWRTGYSNKFKDTRSIRNPFRGDSSIFARCFLLRSRFKSLSELQGFAHENAYKIGSDQAQNGLALSTASKVVAVLTDEFIIAKNAEGIVLRDANRLLLLLRQGAKEPERATMLGKSSLTQDEIWKRLDEVRRQGKFRSVATGIASAGFHNILSGVEKLSLYVDDLTRATELLEIRPGRAYPNIQLFDDRKQVVYFDARADGNRLWSSPIQTWLELATAGPREQEAANELALSLKKEVANVP